MNSRLLNENFQKDDSYWNRFVHFKTSKDSVELYIFQRFYQRKNMSMQFVPEHVMLKLPELQKIVDNMCNITNCVKDALITYSFILLCLSITEQH